MYLADSSPIVKGHTTKNKTMKDGLSLFGVPKEWFDDSDMVEIWGTKFDEGNSDSCEIRFLKKGVIIHQKLIRGY